MRAERMLELSPLVTAATASAWSMPAAARSSWSNPNPTTRIPVNVLGRRRNAFAFLSITATLWPDFSSDPASSLPTRPHPTTTTCTASSRSSAMLSTPLSPARSAAGTCLTDGCAAARARKDLACGPGEEDPGRAPARDDRAGAPTDTEGHRARGVLLGRDLVHRVRDGGDPLRHRDRSVEPPPGARHA